MLAQCALVGKRAELPVGVWRLYLFGVFSTVHIWYCYLGSMQQQPRLCHLETIRLSNFIFSKRDIWNCCCVAPEVSVCQHKVDADV